MSHILLVDDDEDMLKMTGRWLEKDGFAVTCASSGEMALALLEEIRPDLILLDYGMPKMDGPAVLKEIKAREGLKDIPVYYRTGMDYTDEEVKEGMLRPDGFIPKSNGKPYLLRTIKEALV